MYFATMRNSKHLDLQGRFQEGLVTRQQLEDRGTTRQQRRTLVEHGVIRPVNHGVYRTLGTPSNWKQDLLAACLAAGPDAVASHRAAARLWDLIDPPAPVEITVPYPRQSAPLGATTHRSRMLREVDRTVRHRIPVTIPARTLVDLGAVAPELVPDAIERCLYRRLLTTAALWRIIAELGGPGRRGVRPLRRALESRALAGQRPESLLEPLLASIAVAAGVRFEYQFWVAVDGHRYRLDFALPRLLVACEVDGLAAHGTREALNRDLERQNRLVCHGWTVLRYTATRLKQDRRAVREEILAVIAQGSRPPLTL